VQQPHSALDVLRQFIDLIEAERTRNSFQDKRINEIEKQHEQLEERFSLMEPIVQSLRYSTERNRELEYMENPYALDGSPRCNY
jgi:DNA repair exonuclease SbcCD ATPase subunit